MRVVPPVGGSGREAAFRRSAKGAGRRALHKLSADNSITRSRSVGMHPFTFEASTQDEGVRLKSCPRTTRLIASDEAARPTGSSGRDPAFRQPKTPGGARFTSSLRTTATDGPAWKSHCITKVRGCRSREAAAMDVGTVKGLHTAPRARASSLLHIFL